jgi:hypothetical protein
MGENGVTIWFPNHLSFKGLSFSILNLKYMTASEKRDGTSPPSLPWLKLLNSTAP